MKKLSQELLRKNGMIDNSEDSDAQMGGDRPVVLEFAWLCWSTHAAQGRRSEGRADQGQYLEGPINLIESNIINTRSYVYICRYPTLLLRL